MAYGLKRFETRHWKTDYRGVVAICATKGINTAQRQYYERMALKNVFGCSVDELPRGAILCTGNLVDIHMAQYARIHVAKNEVRYGDYANGRYAWEFTDVHLLPEPVPVIGRQNLFTVPDPWAVFEKLYSRIVLEGDIHSENTFDGLSDRILNVSAD